MSKESEKIAREMVDYLNQELKGKMVLHYDPSKPMSPQTLQLLEEEKRRYSEELKFLKAIEREMRRNPARFPDERHQFCDSCPGCRPAMMDEHGKPLKNDHPLMMVLNDIWDHDTTYEERKAWVDVTLNQSSLPRDVQLAQGLMAKFQAKVNRLEGYKINKIERRYKTLN